MSDHHHTAGPFRVEVPPSSSGFGRAIYAEREDGPDIFVAYVGNWKQHPDTENADAALFAAGPVMLETLINLLKPGSVSGAVIEQARDLLASLGHDVRGATSEQKEVSR